MWYLGKLFADAAYYANWLSILYDLKDRRRKNLLVFLPKIEDLTLLTLTCLQTKGKRENGSLLLRNLRFAKIRHIGDYFADCCCKIRDEFTDFRVGFCGLTRARIMSVLWAGFLYLLQPKRKSAVMVRLGFGEAISFSPSVSFTLMHVYMNTGIK